MQKGDPLYSRRKQSQYQRFLLDKMSNHFEDWESTSEYDTDIDEDLVHLTGQVQDRITTMRNLEAAQQPVEFVIQEVAAVISVAVPTTTPVPEAMDVDAGLLAPTMGPGTPVQESEMPEVFGPKGAESADDVELLTDYEDEDEGRRDQRPMAARLSPIGFFQNLLDPVDEGDFDDEKEERLVVSLTVQHERPIVWRAQCIQLWQQLVDTAATANQMDPTNPRTVQEQYPILFQYLAEGGPDGEESVLTPKELEMGKAELTNTVTGRAMIFNAA